MSEGFALFDGDDRLVMCNSRFCRDFRDTVRDLRPGLAFAHYVERVSRSRHLFLPEGIGAAEWCAERLRKHADRRAMFNVRHGQDRWLQVSEHRTANGGTVVLQTDVTDIIRLERQERLKLKDKQTRMIRATLDHLDQGVCIFDEHGRMVAWNEKTGALLNLPARRLHLGASFSGLLERVEQEFRFSDAGDREAFITWAALGGHRGPIHFELMRDTGAIIQVFGRGMPDGGFLFSSTDVTAEREAARRLTEVNEMLEARVMERTLELEDALSAAERANASKSRFVAAASHDLLQPLSAAKLFISSLSDRSQSAGDRMVLNKAESALTSAEQLIDALLDISKLESDGLNFDIRPVALSEILAPLRDEMEVLAARKGLRLRMVNSSLTVETDPSYLRRVVQNLVGNAIRYTAEGTVLVGVRRAGGTARIEVRDTGPGIAEDDQSAIFEEFHRLDTGASANDGLGLGLAIVERACARLGHPLGLWSEPGRGSCFMVSLPVLGSAAPKRAVSPTPARPAGLAQAGLIVLLVENDPQLRRAMTVLMESWGVNVIEAENADGALELLQDLEITPDALVLDYQLGAGMSGTQLFGEITTRLGRLPCVIVSADRSVALREACDGLKIELLSKPVDRHRLGRFFDVVVRGAVAAV